MARTEKGTISIDAKPNRSNLGRNVALALALLTAAAGTGVVLTRGSGPAPETPPPTTAAATLPPETPSPTLPPTEKPTVKPTEAPKPLPEIINKDTVKFVVKSPEEVQRMMDEAKAKGENKIALPDFLNNDGLSVREVHFKSGKKALAIISDKEGDYNIPALSKGKIFEMGISNGSTFSEVGIVTPEGKVLVYIFPNPSSSTLKEGDNVELSQKTLSTRYQPTSQSGKAFIDIYLAKGFTDAPSNTVTIIALGSTSGLTNTTNESILTTKQGEVVLLATQK